jgi:hypothetical protein
MSWYIPVSASTSRISFEVLGPPFGMEVKHRFKILSLAILEALWRTSYVVSINQSLSTITSTSKSGEQLYIKPTHSTSPFALFIRIEIERPQRLEACIGSPEILLGHAFFAEVQKVVTSEALVEVALVMKFFTEPPPPFLFLGGGWEGGRGGGISGYRS